MYDRHLDQRRGGAVKRLGMVALCAALVSVSGCGDSETSSTPSAPDALTTEVMTEPDSYTLDAETILSPEAGLGTQDRLRVQRVAVRLRHDLGRERVRSARCT